VTPGGPPAPAYPLTGTGLADPQQQRRYQLSIGGLKADWAGLDFDERVERMFEAVNARLREVGVPAVELHPRASGADASFTPDVWMVKLGRAAKEKLGAASPAGVDWAVETFYHEARHAEQDFLVARLLRGLGMGAAEIAAIQDIPAEVAEAASAPLLPTDPEYAAAVEWWAAAGPRRQRLVAVNDAKRQRTRSRPRR
jgi:hypothetical protein